MTSKFENNKNIVFIGMPGSGKTSIGEAVAEKLQLPFFDVDIYIEKKEEKSIKDIFQSGEEYFRNIESQAVAEIIQHCPCVISTGGGVVKNFYNMETLQKNSIIFFINRPIENILQDIDISTRPLLVEGTFKIYKLYEERYALYKKYCNIEILNDMDFQKVVEKILQCLKDIN